jgi:hypothetical protein
MRQASIAGIAVFAGAACCAFAQVPRVTFEPRVGFRGLLALFPLKDESISMLRHGGTHV